MSYTIVFFGQHSLQSLIKSNFRFRSGQMFRLLEKDSRIQQIIYVNPYFYSHGLAAFLKNLTLNFKSLSPLISTAATKQSPKVTVLNILNLKRINKMKNTFYSLLKKEVTKLIDVDERSMVVWLYNPAEYAVYELFPKAKKIFDTVDNWMEMDLDLRQYPWYVKSDIMEGYRYLCSSKVKIISNGKAMTQFYIQNGANNQDIAEVPNGIDTDFFAPERSELSPDLLPLSKLRRPIIGYVGVLQERFDKNLFEYLLRMNPQYTFVVIGPIKSFRDFKFDIKAPNLVYLGKVPYLYIPQHIAQFDVGIIPHKVDRMTDFMSPIKVYEYLAMGKPVVTTCIGGIEDVAQYCFVAKDNETFNRMLSEAMVAKLGNRTGKIREEISWSRRMAILWDGILK